jgi:2-polyprenyl-6-methoxyphenol hydroxylase-like FAD-dependent oxidoreductase
MKVLISGAGIAGTALAFWLSRLGHDVTVVERFPALRATGLQLDLRGHGITVLQRMGLEAAFRAKSPPEQGVQVVNSAGKRRAYFPVNKSGKGLQSFTTDYEIMRGDLCRLMYDAVTDRAKYIFNTSITKLINHEKNVEVSFADGTTSTFDLVIGADGVNSRTRALLGMDGFQPCRGLFVAYMTLPEPIAEGESYDATMFMSGSGRTAMVRRHSPDKLQVYLFCKTDNRELVEAPRGSREERDAFAKIMRGAGWKIDAFLDRLDDMPDFYCERMGLVKLDSWSKGCIGLLGDAGYCPSANTGMGTTSAMVGAYILAGEISRHGDNVSEALQAYERKFRPFMDQVQAGVVESGGGIPTSTLGIALMQMALALASFFRIDVFGYILKEGSVKNWELPEYDALKVEAKS